MKPLKRIHNYRPRGLGDLVEKFAKPVARTIDRIAGTHLDGCGSCLRRRDTLNRTFPFDSTPPV